MQLAIILTSGCLLIQIFYHGAVVSAEPSVQDPSSKDVHNKTNVLWNSTFNDNLKRDLFVNYNKFALPMFNNKPTDVKIGLTVRHVDIDELKGKITVYGWIRMQWQDDKFKWSPSDYGNIATMHVAADDVWRPDIALFNSATDRDDHLGGSQLIVAQTGTVLWVPPAVFTAFCSLDLQLWPFDTQVCNLKIGSWSMADMKLSLYGGKDSETEVDSMVENNEWAIRKVSTKFETSEQFYNFVKFEFVLDRRAAMYKALIFTPASCIVLLVLSSFWLPPQMGEKLLLNGIVIIVISAFLMYFAQLLPVLAQNTPLVVLFYSSSLLLVSLSTIVSVIVLYLSSAKHRRRVPSFIRNLLNGPLSYFLFLSHLSPDIDPKHNAQNELTEQTPDVSPGFDDQQSMFASTTRSIQFDWIVLATAIDRIMFIFYCIVFVILAITYSV
ncbi:neuronal acetylcholine receptor subunit alpha-5-like [Episyrphus balteatus]|uniref:neuronal acetylcholine receptor subunit alpha-5-like n=1 Tax=Episyrphus balteatus TaxID=286459 RepID=UPI002485B7BA|nr:neuronal acetylcholine receptor subunit alpha-5-like [Episyrphus balteatus]